MPRNVIRIAGAAGVVLGALFLYPWQTAPSEPKRKAEDISAEIAELLRGVPSGIHDRSTVRIQSCRLMIETPTNLAQCEQALQAQRRYLSIDLSAYAFVRRGNSQSPVTLRQTITPASALGQEEKVPVQSRQDGAGTDDLVRFLKDRPGTVDAYLHCNGDLIAVRNKTYHTIFTRGEAAEAMESALRDASRHLGC